MWSKFFFHSISLQTRKAKVFSVTNFIFTDFVALEQRKIAPFITVVEKLMFSLPDEKKVIFTPSEEKVIFPSSEEKVIFLSSAKSEFPP